jgi:hypothetical protein
MFPTIDAYTGGRVPTTLLFNKQNGIFFTFVCIPLALAQFDDLLYVGREAMFDHANDVVVGGLTKNADGVFEDNFKVIPASEQKEKVYERFLNLQAEQKITKRYPLVDQINLLVAAIQRLAKEHEFTDLPEFKALAEMTSYVDQCIETNQAKKEFYSGNPDVDYYSDERVAAEESAKMEGGIHEAIGPRVVSGGSIFGSDVK